MLGLVTPSVQSSPEQVSILDIGNHKSHFMSALLPLRRINALRQMRQTFDEEALQNLAENLSVQHLMQSLIVARFNVEQTQEHLRVINEAWGTSYKIDALSPTLTEDGLFYFVLIAGERRLRAHLLLWDRGCEACREDYSEDLPKGFCYIRHFHDDRIPVRIRLEATPSIVLTLQLTENTYIAPPPHEVATAIAEYYPLWRLLNPDKRKKDFATEVNKSVDTLNDYFHYSQLPEFVQEQVEKGAIPFGIALEIARLQADKESDDQLELWLRKAIAGMFSVPAFAQLVNEYLKNKHSGQTSLFEIMTDNAKAEMERQNIRLIVDPKFRQALHTSMEYDKRVIDLVRSGRMLLPDSPYSARSVLGLMRKQLEIVRERNYLFRELLGAEGYQEHIEVYNEYEVHLRVLEEMVVRE